MGLSVCVCVCVGTYVCVRLPASMSTCMCLCVCMHVRVCLCACSSVCLCMCTCTCVSVHVRAWCACVHMRVCPSLSSGVTDRSLASALAQAQASRREHGFRSVFQHMKRPQALKSPAESYVLHIVSLVHHVQGTYKLLSPCHCFSLRAHIIKK